MSPLASLYDPARHEALRAPAWNDRRARETIAHIVTDTKERFSAEALWPMHPRDADDGDTAPATPLYHGACGVIWALNYLATVGACSFGRDYAAHLAPLRVRNAQWLATLGGGSPLRASYLMGDTGLSLLEHWLAPTREGSDRLARSIRSNVDNPTRELMWGSPGTLLAALFMHEHDRAPRWAELFRATARKLRSELLWSSEYRCEYWTQDMYGQQGSYLDAVHGFVATASPLIRGRHLLDDDWPAWADTIANTIRRSASRQGALVNWRTWLYAMPGMPMLMQFCHGAPGFVTCLADFPGTALDDLLLAAGESTWVAGPLRKGSNLCHGTGGNGYAFLKLYARTGDPQWLARARAFAMHGIDQTEQEERRVGRLRYSLWTGDLGFAVYLWDCIAATAHFPTLDIFFKTV